MKSRGCIFLDRDGVLIAERGAYTYRVADMQIIRGIPQTLQRLKSAGYALIVITNQGGLALGAYTMADMNKCHAYLQSQCKHCIDAFYHSPDHPFFGGSLTRKPRPYLFKRALAEHPHIDTTLSWMVGDSERDLIPARKLGIRTIQVGSKPLSAYANHYASDLPSAAEQFIFQQPPSHRGKQASS